MSREEKRPRGRGQGRFYSGLLTLIVTAVVALAASALYVTAGGELFGWTGGAFGLRAQEPMASRALERARAAAWGGRHTEALALYDSILTAHTRDGAGTPGERTVAVERARVLAWAERYGDAADALAGVDDPADAESRLDRARYLWWAGRPREADSLLSDVLGRTPDLAEARELQDLVRPSVEPAVDIASRWVEERPADAFAHLWLARALVREDRSVDALAHYRRSFDSAGDSEPEVMLEAAGIALGVDSLRYAAEVLSRYLSLVDSPDPETRLRLARAYSWSGRYAEAESEYRHVLAMAERRTVRFELARMLVDAGRYRSAIAELRRLDAQEPSRDVRRVLATAFARDGRSAEAAALLLALVEQREEIRDLNELARVLAEAERYGEAAAVLARVEARAGANPALRIRRARYLWWAGELVEADAQLTALLATHPDHADARQLRAQVRLGIDPSVELAREWLREDGSRLNRIRLARALTEAERPGEALPHYLAALDGDDPELRLEAAEAAQAADSLDAAARLLEEHIATADAPEPETLLRLARVHGWAGRPGDAARTYGDYLALRPDDAEARLARARQLAWQDSAAWPEAEAELETVLGADPGNTDALRLRGDLRRWRGDADAALAYYRQAEALQPDAPGLAEGIRLAEAMRVSEPAPADVTRVAWAVDFDAFSDSDDFQWLATRVSRDYTFRAGTVSFGLTQGYSSGLSAPGISMDAYGMGARIAGRFPFADRYAAVVELGASAFQGAAATATWGAGIEYRDLRTRGVLRYDRSPGLREAGRIAALENEAVLDRLELSGTHVFADWESTGDLQVQRFGSHAGDGTRYAVMVRADRPVGATGLTVGAMVRTIGATEPAPAAGWGGLYWAPRSYIAPALTFGLGRPIGSSWWLGLRAAPGYAWIDERDTGLVRFRDGETPILEAGATVGYRRGPWTIDLSGDVGGALRSGYRSSSMSIRISRTGGLQ